MSVEYNIIILLFIHFVADFIFQSREMGRNKGKSIYWLTVHVLAYTAVTTLGWVLLLGFISIPFNELLLFGAITFSTHWVTDFVTSRISGYFYLKMMQAKKDRQEKWRDAMPGDKEYDGEGDKSRENKWEFHFWTTIGADQFIHALTLILTYKYFF